MKHRSRSVATVLMLGLLTLASCGRSPVAPAAAPESTASGLVPPRGILGGAEAPARPPHEPARTIATPAAPQRDPEEPFAPQGGTAQSLPIGGYSWITVLNWARTRMPGVQAAMQEFAARGYLHHADHDSAFVLSQPPVSFVQLTYERPGLLLPPGEIGWAVIWVKTTAIPHTQQTLSDITAGIVIADAEHRRFYSGDSLPGLAQSDPSFDVVPAGGSDGGSGTPEIIPVIERFDVTSPAPKKTKLDQWLDCCEWAAVACTSSMLEWNGVTFVFVAPWVAIASFSLCMVVGAIICITAAQ